MIATVDVIDTVARVALFGVQFWDRLTNTVVRDGLRATLYPVADPRLRVTAVPNRSGIHVLHAAPGLAAATWGAGDDLYWAHPPVTLDYRCEVADDNARFHPFAFGVRLPFRGLFTIACAASPPDDDSPAQPLRDAVELFSTPTRIAPGAIAAVRAELVDALDEKPAAWCRLVVEMDGEVLGNALADANGKALALFPFPEPVRSSPPQTSPPSGVAGALMAWQVRLRAYHSRTLEGLEMPDYCALQRQPAVTLLAERSPPGELGEITIPLARESVVSSHGDSRLFVAHG